MEPSLLRPTSSESLQTRLASHPEHLSRFMTLEIAARAALQDGSPVDAIRRDYDKFQEAMTRIYGAPIKYADVAAATLLNTAKALHKQLTEYRRECAGIPVATEISPATGLAIEMAIEETSCDARLGAAV